MFIITDFQPSNQLQKILYGKSLLQSELLEFQSLLHEHFINGYVAYSDAISSKENHWICNRCGTNKSYHFYQHECARCSKLCVYCRNCIMMGKSQQCVQLVTWIGPDVEFLQQEGPMRWGGKLSEGQEVASNRVVQAILQKETCLVWAVCGAGKTEVLFSGIEAALKLNQRVCIATPRTDVVLELAPRIKTAFPYTSIAALYGGSEEKQNCAQLVISTTHQLLRYDQAFDTIIVDEVDAFPYSMDQSLQFAVEKSRKSQSALIYLTATASKQMQRLVAANKLACVTIPARYHRHSIPVPQLKWTGNWKKIFSKGRIPSPLYQWFLQKIQLQIPFLIFFPNIERMNQYLPLFQKHDRNLPSVHAEDPERKAKVNHLRTGQVLGLLTTTILERGVTIPRLHVAVIGAEEEIFTESALVQIAGRVGRSKEDPKGEVVFFHYGKTHEMVQAVKQIHKMNREARERGLIDD